MHHGIEVVLNCCPRQSWTGSDVQGQRQGRILGRRCPFMIGIKKEVSIAAHKEAPRGRRADGQDALVGIESLLHREHRHETQNREHVRVDDRLMMMMTTHDRRSTITTTNEDVVTMVRENKLTIALSYWLEKSEKA